MCGTACDCKACCDCEPVTVSPLACLGVSCAVFSACGMIKMQISSFTCMSVLNSFSFVLCSLFTILHFFLDYAVSRRVYFLLSVTLLDLYVCILFIIVKLNYVVLWLLLPKMQVRFTLTNTKTKSTETRKWAVLYVSKNDKNMKWKYLVCVCGDVSAGKQESPLVGNVLFSWKWTWIASSIVTTNVTYNLYSVSQKSSHL